MQRAPSTHADRPLANTTEVSEAVGEVGGAIAAYLERAMRVPHSRGTKVARRVDMAQKRAFDQRLVAADLEPVDLIMRAALSAVNCGGAIDIADFTRAVEHLTSLREAVIKLERAGEGERPEVQLLRDQETRLTEYLLADKPPAEGTN